MGIFDILTLLCGLALFLFGMDLMGDALKKSAGRKLKTILGNLTSTKFKAVILGLGVTAVIQSSSATTVMVVGFVNSGTMALAQAIGVILGANIGTAVTSWLTALNGIEGGAEALAWTKFLKPDAWMPVLALIGIACIMFSKRSKTKDAGTILMGFAVLMVGMSMMSDAVKPLSGDEGFKQILTLFSNPVLGVLAGMVLTAIVQSSSASIGILQALSSTGAISFGMAIPIILGQNIGTCVTAMISSIGANKNGKRAAVMHLYFNVIGVVVWLSMYYLVGWILESTGTFGLLTWAEGSTINMWGIAAVHTGFKLLAVGLMFPFTGLLEKMACATIRGTDKKGDEFTDMLDDRLLVSPTVAIERSRTVTCQMASVSCRYLLSSIDMLQEFDSKTADDIRENEDKVDVYEDVLGSYLVKLSSQDMEEKDSHEVSKLLHMIGDLERISDHSVNLLESAEEIKDKELSFSPEATEEMATLYGAVREIVTVTEAALLNADLEMAARVEPLEQVVDELRDGIKRRHIDRLRKSECSIEHGFVLSDILTNLERVSDHCSNVAGCLIEMSKHDMMDLHDYLHRVKAGGMEYKALYDEYSAKYALPAETAAE